MPSLGVPLVMPHIQLIPHLFICQNDCGHSVPLILFQISLLVLFLWLHETQKPSFDHLRLQKRGHRRHVNQSGIRSGMSGAILCVSSCVKDVTSTRY